jgi:hypothetical protein
MHQWRFVLQHARYAGIDWAIAFSFQNVVSALNGWKKLPAPVTCLPKTIAQKPNLEAVSSDPNGKGGQVNN